MKILSGGNLRSIGKSNQVAGSIRDQKSFDYLFDLLFHTDRKIVMRSVDAVEKITVKYPEFLQSHKSALLKLLRTAETKELKWHLALLIPRLRLSKAAVKTVWEVFSNQVLDNEESRIVRVNSLQAINDLSVLHPGLQTGFRRIILKIKQQKIPSLSARIKKLRPFS